MGECALMQTGPEQQKVWRQVETFPPNTAHLQAPCCTHTCCAAPTPPHTRARERRHPRPASKHSSGRLSFRLFLPFISRLDSIFSSMPTPPLRVIPPRSSVPCVSQLGGLSESLIAVGAEL